MTILTDSQLNVLRWLRDNPSNHGEWTVNGEPIRRQHPDTWNLLVISGPTGNVNITARDNEALHRYVTAGPSPNKLYGPNEAGLAALAAAEKTGAV